MRILSRIIVWAISAIVVFTPFAQTVKAQSEQNPQSINVCFVNLDNAGNIMTTLPEGTSIGINLYTDPGHLVEGQINSYGTTSIPITQSSATPANTDLTGSGNLNGYCVKQTFSNDINHEYTYTQATVTSNLDWLPERYNDEISIKYVHPDIAFPYSGEWFDNIAGNEAQRNTNADGHITMSSDRQDRTLVIVSQLDQNLPTYAVNFSDNVTGASEYTLSNLPQNIQTGSTMHLVFTVQNMGTLKWLSSLDGTAANPVNVSFHWKNLNNPNLDVYNGNRAALSNEIDYTQNGNVDLVVNAPTTPGDYQLIIDLVHEGVTWFSAQGANTYTLNIQVGGNQITDNSQQKTDVIQPVTSNSQPATILSSPSAAILTTTTIGTYTVQPYQGGSWHCGGYDCLVGIAEDYYHCSANGIPNNYTGTDINILRTQCWWPIYEANLGYWQGYIPPVYANTPWNYIEVGWVLTIPANGTIPPSNPPVSNFNGSHGGTINDPWGGMNGAWSVWPQVTFDRWITWDGSDKGDALKKSETIWPTPPTLTGISTSADGKTATVYGVAIPKNMPMHIKVWNEYRYCWACGSAWEFFYQQGTAQNVKVVIFKNNWEYVGQVWNDRPDGRWQITLPIGSSVNPGDRIFAEVQIEADYTFSGLHWWSNTTETRKFDLRDPKYTGYPYFGSGAQGWLTVPSIYVDKRSNEEKWIDWRATLLGATGGSSITNVCGYPAKTYSNLKNGPGAILFVNGRPIYSYGGTWDTFNYYGDKCTRFGVPTNDPQEPAGVGPFNTPGAYQDFQKGRIYWSWKHQGKFTYGIISNKFEQAGGTWSVYGWPISETYTTTINNQPNVCQNFEGGIDGKNYLCEQDVVPLVDKLVWPISNSKVETDPRDCNIEGICASEVFNYNDPMGRTAAHHTGIDLINADGTDTANKPVRAFANGIVKLVDPNGGYPGGAVMLEHKINKGGLEFTFYTVYMHITNIIVSKDQYINAGDIIANVLPQLYDNDVDRIVYGDQWVGKPNSHLHFEVRSFYSYLNQRASNPSACNRDSLKPHDLPIWTMGFGYLDDGGSALQCGYYDPNHLPANIFNSLNLIY